MKNTFDAKKILKVTGILSVFVFVLFVTLSLWIGYEIKLMCDLVTERYPAEYCSQSMSLQLRDESRSFKDRNNAIRALGLIGNEKSLYYLDMFYTGMIPEKEPLDAGISQYELKKAIGWIKNDNNYAGYIWKPFFDLK